MTTVAPTHTYPDGQALNASGHSNNLYTDPPEQGLYSSVNGELDFSANYSGNVHRYHLQHSESVFMDQYQWEEPITIFDDTAGGTEDGQAVPYMLGIRFSLPSFDGCDTLRIGYSFFLSAARAVKVDRADGNGQNNDNPWQLVANAGLEAHVAVYFNGVEKPELRIPLPRSLFVGTTTGGAQEDLGTLNHITWYEHMTGHQHTGSFILQNHNIKHNNLQFRVRLESPAEAGQYDVTLGLRLGTILKDNPLNMKVRQRLTFGCGQVNVVAKGLKTS